MDKEKKVAPVMIDVNFESQIIPTKYPPEHHMLAAMINRAVLDLNPNAPFSVAPPYWRADAFEWIWSDAIAPFSFLWVCDMISVDPNHIRSLILKRYPGAFEVWKKMDSTENFGPFAHRYRK